MNRSHYKESILFCSAFTPPLNAGGGKNAYNFARFLADKGYPVTLLSLNRRGKLPAVSKAGDLIIRRILYFNQNIFAKLLSLFIILPNYLYYVFKSNVVFIYGGNIIGYEVIILFSKLLGRKVVFQSLLIHDDDIETLVKRRFAGAVRKWILKQITVYFSINPLFKNLWVKTYSSGEKIFESPQGVNTKIFFPVSLDEKMMLRNKLNIPSDAFVIITVGYLIKRKGFQELFESLAKMVIPFYYFIIGNYFVPRDHYMAAFNSEMDELYHIAKSMLGEKIVFTGPKENVHEYLQASDIFILNSMNEGLPNSLLEAMACGLPCIIRNIPGRYDYIAQNRENIFLVEDVAFMIKNINELFSQSNIRKGIGKAAIKTVSKKASIDVVWQQLIDKLFIHAR